MDALTIVGVALRSVARAPVRSALTTLGVVIGVAAVVATLSIGEGAREKIERALSTPQARMVFVIARARPDRRRSGLVALPLAEHLRPADYYAIRSGIVGMRVVTPSVYLTSGQVQGNGRSMEA